MPHPRYPSLPLEYPPYQGHAPARPELAYRTPPRNLLVQRAKDPRRPRRAVPMGRTRGHHVYAGRRGRRPLPCLTSCPYLRGRHVYAGRRPLPRPTHVYTPTPGPHPTSCRHHMVGRDVLGAPRPLDAHGNATCTRAAGDVGPYHASPMSTPHARSTPMVGRDVLGAPRTRDAHGTHTGTPHVRGPPRTSAPTMPHVLSTPYALSTPMVGRDVLGAPRPRDAHGTPTGTPRVRGPPGTSAPTMPHP